MDTNVLNDNVPQDVLIQAEDVKHFLVKIDEETGEETRIPLDSAGTIQPVINDESVN